MVGPYRAVAESLLKTMKDNHPREANLRPARESEFPHLHLRDYAKVGKALAALGFRRLADLEHVDVSNATDSLTAPTLIRTYVSPDAKTTASHYQVRALRKRAFNNLLVGLMNLRWIAAPSSFLSLLKTRNYVELDTELEGGIVISTGNAQVAEMVTPPPEILREEHPLNTPIETLVARHAARVASLPGAAVSIETPEALFARARRILRRRAEHRASLGWVTRDELRAMADGETALADAIYDEIQQILRETGESLSTQ